MSRYTICRSKCVAGHQASSQLVQHMSEDQLSIARGIVLYHFLKKDLDSWTLEGDNSNPIAEEPGLGENLACAD